MHNIISTFENCIASVQLKISDYISKVPNIKEGITSRLSEIGQEISIIPLNYYFMLETDLRFNFLIVRSVVPQK